MLFRVNLAFTYMITFLGLMVLHVLHFIYTRLLGPFAPIFYLNCEHVLFVYIFKQWGKNFADLKKKKLANFQEFNFFKLKTLKFLTLINLPCGHVISHKKFGPDRFSRFDVYWIQTNKQTDKPNLYIDEFKIFLLSFLDKTFSYTIKLG